MIRLLPCFFCYFRLPKAVCDIKGTGGISAPLPPSFGAFLGGTPYPPSNFMREKRDIRGEQERQIALQGQQSQQQETVRRSLEGEGVNKSATEPCVGTSPPNNTGARNRLNSARPRESTASPKGGYAGSSVALPPLTVPSFP